MTTAKGRGAYKRYSRAKRRHDRTYHTQMHKKKTPNWLDDWRFIWSHRTYNGQKRSWVQKLFGW